MAKIYERLLGTNILREKRRDSFDPKRVTNSVRRGQYLYGYLAGNTASDSFFFFFFFITSLNCFGCFRKEVLFCQASMKIKTSPLSVHC